MEKSTQLSKEHESIKKEDSLKEKTHEELDADNEVHKTSPDLILKENHHLPVDDEVKKG